MKDRLNIPWYLKVSITLIGGVCLVLILFHAQSILVPLIMSGLIAILLRPVVDFLHHKWRFPSLLAITFSVLLLILFVVGIFFFISIQISDIALDWSKIEQNIYFHLENLQELIRLNFNLSKTEQESLLTDATKDSIDTGKRLIGNTLISFTDTLLNTTLIPIYTFLFLIYKTHLTVFLAKLVPTAQHANLKDILEQIKESIHSYIVGLAIEMVVVASLTFIGFSIIGLKYALVLGIITGLLNLIPYVGILIACCLSIVATLTGTPDLYMILSAIIVILIVQVIDNNLLVPMIVSSKVEINAFISIVGILIGSAIWGFSGMFLAIPSLAILKVIFDRIPSLSPLGYLMGDDIPKTFNWDDFQNEHSDNASTTSENIEDQMI